ncbi:uncharacterized protein LOC129829313 [Salvelinus fontinalis]|uniref:uncharacterized protein LOC129829313 n=1 Tax=Salvelinus fontinalis TaxID=8038 RepID=UPI0024857987|nr:uncharacterized protein LOC129829313 [Salvelinus fontinalis]
MTDHHLKLNLGKTELLFLPGKDCPFHDLAITVDNSIVSSSQSAKNLGVILDNTLSFSTNIKAVARSCRFMLYNIRRVRPCLTQEAAQVLIQALVISRLDYCNSLLAGLPACAIKPLQLIQNAAARLVFNLPKFSHVTPLLRSLHWLPVEARIRYKTMVLAYGAVRGTAPQYLQALIRPYTQTRALQKLKQEVPVLRTSTLVNVAEALFQQVFRHYGLPENIISDCGPQSTSRVWRAFMEKLGVTPALAPWTPGQTEAPAIGEWFRHAEEVWSDAHNKDVTGAVTGSHASARSPGSPAGSSGFHASAGSPGFPASTGSSGFHVFAGLSGSPASTSSSGSHASAGLSGSMGDRSAPCSFGVCVIEE